MNEILKREYESVEEVFLKPNQVLIKPIKPVLEKSFVNIKFKAIISSILMFLVFALSILMLFQKDTSLRVIGGFLLGVTIAYAISALRK